MDVMSALPVKKGVCGQARRYQSVSIKTPCIRQASPGCDCLGDKDRADRICLLPGRWLG